MVGIPTLGRWLDSCHGWLVVEILGGSGGETISIQKQSNLKWRFLLQNLNINRESHGSNKKAIEKCEDVPFHRQDRRVEAKRSRIKDRGIKGEGYHYSISSSSL